MYRGEFVYVVCLLHVFVMCMVCGVPILCGVCCEGVEVVCVRRLCGVM